MKVAVFGASGSIGTLLLQALRKEHPGWTVVGVSRSADRGDGWIQGDIFSAASVKECAKDCQILFSCIGFEQYERKYWAEHWPLVVDNLLSALEDGDRKLVFCDNLYAYGNPKVPITTATPKIASGLHSKPAVRALLHEKFQSHPAWNRIAILGASDFFGPGLDQKSFLGDTVTGKIVVGSTPLVVGRKDCIHDFGYAPDVARAMVVASTQPEAYGKFWIVPHSVHGSTMQQIVEEIAELHGSTKKPNCTVLGPWMLTLLSPFVGFLGEIKEMLHIWTQDYQVQDSDFFGMQATPRREALQALVQYYESK